MKAFKGKPLVAARVDVMAAYNRMLNSLWDMCFLFSMYGQNHVDIPIVRTFGIGIGTGTGIDIGMSLVRCVSF
jgi:hypothetical protein